MAIITLYTQFWVTHVFKTPICSNVIDILGNSLSVLLVLHLLLCGFLCKSSRWTQKLHPTVPSRTGIHETHACTHLKHLPSALLMSCFMRHGLSACGVMTFSLTSGNHPAPQWRAAVLLTPTSTSTLQVFALYSVILIVAVTYFLTNLDTQNYTTVFIRFLSFSPHVLWFLVCDFCTAWQFLGTRMRCYSKVDGLSTVALLCLLFRVLCLCAPLPACQFRGGGAFWSFAHCCVPSTYAVSGTEQAFSKHLVNEWIIRSFTGNSILATFCCKLMVLLAKGLLRVRDIV